VHNYAAYYPLHHIYYIYVSVSYLHIYDRSRGARTRGTIGASISQGRWLRAKPRQAPMHLTKILEFILSHLYPLFMILGCALSSSSWIDTLLHYSNFPIYPCYPITRDSPLAMARRRCSLSLVYDETLL
jgi:hypothetical protein